MYLVAGSTFQYFVKKERGIRVLPNFDFWRNFVLLTMVKLLDLSLFSLLSLSVLRPTHMGGRPATCAYWVDYTQAHVVQ